MDPVKLNAKKAAAGTPEDLEAYLKEPAARQDLAAAVNFLADDINGKFAFMVDLLRFMLDASGVMAMDDFNSAYQQYMEAFTAKFGDVGTETPGGKPEEGAEEAN